MFDLFIKYNIDPTGWVITNFEESPVMQPYLLAIAISDFISVSAPDPHNTYNVITK